MGYDKILIVDDSSTARMIIKRCFDIAGFQNSKFFYAENGIDAITILDSDTVDLIVTDINMPKMDGENFIKKIKNNIKTETIPLIVISSLMTAELENEYKNKGVIGMIKKPLSPKKLIQIIGNGASNEEF